MRISIKREDIIEWNDKSQTILDSINQKLQENTLQGEIEACMTLAEQWVQEYVDKNRKLLTLSLLMGAELASFSDDSGRRPFEGRDVDAIQEMYENIVFLLRRAEFGLPEEYTNAFSEYIQAEQISKRLVEIVIQRTYTLQQKDELLDWVERIYKDLHTFCFIACVNNDLLWEEALRYISELEIPEGYEIEVLSVRDVKSIYAGYNEGMKASRAKYKIYIHQDVFILNRRFLYEIVKWFRNPTIGMMGVIGSLVVLQDARYEAYWNVGDVWASDYANILHLELQNDKTVPAHEVKAIDGMLMVTQYDIEWDNAEGWHFYDISQSEKFRNRGYQIIVPYQEDAWTYHECGCCSKEGYETSRKAFCERYEGYIYHSADGDDWDGVRNHFLELKRDVFCGLLQGEKYENLASKIKKALSVYSVDSQLFLLFGLLAIQSAEDKDGYSKILRSRTFEEECELMQIIRLLVIRYSFTEQEECRNELIEAMISRKISIFYLAYVFDSSVENGRQQLEKLLSSI